MTRLMDIMAEAGLPVLFEHMGETITLRPPGAAARTVTAIVTREPHDDVGGITGGSAPRITIRVANDSTTGIGSDEGNITGDGGYSVDIAARPGGDVITRPVERIVTHNAASVLLELR